MNDVLFVLLKHKWKIGIFAVLGFASALGLYLLDPPLYQSEAKLLVKYVLERNTIDQVEKTKDTGGRPDENTVIGSELVILSSWDLAEETAKAVSPERLLPKGKEPNVTAGAFKVRDGLKASAVKGTNVILVSFKHTDPAVAREGLEQLVRSYKVKHLALHRSREAYNLVTQEKDAAKSELTRVEGTLKTEKQKAEILSLPDTAAALSTALARTQLDLYDAETELAEQSARVEALQGSAGSQNGTSDSQEAPKEKAVARPGDVQDYQLLNARLVKLRQKEAEDLQKFLPGSSAVVAVREQITSVESQLREMERRHPALTNTAGGEPREGQLDLVTERIKLEAAKARLTALNQRFEEIRAKAAKFADVEPDIAELLRTKEINENTYKLITERLKKSEIDASLSPERMPNMGFVQEPSPAMRIGGEKKKAIVALAGGGLGLGLALAFLLELLFNRTVKRPLELETRLGIPLMLSVPYLSSSTSPSRPLLGAGDTSKAVIKADKNGTNSARSWQMDHFIRPYAEAVRDRLVLYFELSRLTRKPKLVAVTGLSKGAGVSTLAGGLAAALSETGDGKVLLVDMNVERAEVQPFFNGEAVCSLVEALQPTSPMAAAADNLYLATVADSSAGPMQLVPKRFYDLIPHLKASSFDYIIFDMPPVSESSATLAIAGFMDKVLFVVEAEENNVDTLKRSLGELVSARANISGIFNKTRSYSPKWMKIEV